MAEATQVRSVGQAGNSKRPTPTIMAVGAVVVVGIIALIFGTGRGSSGAADAANAQTFKVAEGPLTISVTEAGTIKAMEQIIIKNEVEGQTQILYIIPEGTVVNKGDLLVELDSSKLQDQKISQQITVQNAEAAFIRARENLEVTKNQAKSDVAKAALDFRFAKEDLQNYVEGQYKKDLKEAENKIRIAEEETTRAKDAYAASMRLFEQKFQSLTEVKADELALQKAKVSEELARDELKLLKDFTYGRKQAELAANVDQTQAALERSTRKASADVVQAEADLRAKDSEFARQKQQLEKVLRLIDKTKIVAPAAGLAVYATTAQGGGWRGNTEPLAEGQTVRERQDLIYLPTTSTRMAELKIHESSLDKVKVGLPVRVTVDALPGQAYTGRVAKIAPLPDAQASFMNPDLKVYNTQINLDGDNSGLKTGMSCRAEIIVQQYAKAVYVPVQAIVRIAGKPTVFVATAKGSERRVIELGLDNNVNAQVLSGLNAGEEVLRAPPLAEASAHQEGQGPEMAASTQPSATQPTTAPVGPGAVAAQANAGVGSSGGLPATTQAATQPTTNASGDLPEWIKNMPPEMQDRMRQRWEAMTPAQREAQTKRMEAMRKRMESMTPEQREQMRQQFQGRRRGGGGGGGEEGGGGGGWGGGGGGGGFGGGGGGGGQ